MAIVYVREQGATIHRNYMQLVIRKGSQIYKRIPITYVEQLILFGNIQITSQTVEALLTQGIEIHYFTYGGKYIGCSKGEHSRNIFLRCSQFELFSDAEKKKEIARKIVSGKIMNQMAVLKRYQWHKENCYDWKSDYDSLQKNLDSLADKETIQEFMGVEGLASTIYFKAYGNMFLSELKFDGRNRRPPKDPVNAVLSLTYTFLTRDMCNILDAQSFESYLGFLHGIRYGRKSLALDLIELFRQPAADRLVLRLFNKQILTKYDFEEESDEGIFLNTDGFQKFCYEYERWMNDKRKGDSWRICMRQQVQMLRDAVQHGAAFQTWLWESETSAKEME